MQTLILVIHVMVGVVLVGVVMLQRSEGGALGIGGSAGGGGGGGLMSGRGTANLLTRATAILGAAFMTTSIVLAIMASGGDGGSVLDAEPLTPVQGPAAPAVPAGPAVPVGE